MEVFSSEWAEAWREEINADARYREVGRKWVGGVTLRLFAKDDPKRTRAVFLDLEGGECLSACTAGDEEIERSLVAIRASDDAWRRVLAGEIDPVLGLMGGTLRLEKGSLLRVLPFADGARAMLAAATRVGGERPDLGPGGSPQGSR